MEVVGWSFQETFAEGTDWLTLPSSCLKPRCHAWRCSSILCSHKQRPPTKVIRWKGRKNPDNMVETHFSYGPPSRSAFYGGKINSFFAKAPVRKVFCNLKSNAFLPDPLSVHTLQLLNSLFLAIGHISSALTRQGLTTGLPCSRFSL